MTKFIVSLVAVLAMSSFALANNHEGEKKHEGEHAEKTTKTTTKKKKANKGAEGEKAAATEEHKTEEAAH